MDIEKILLSIIFGVIALVVFFVLLPVIFNNLNPIVTNSSYNSNYPSAMTLFKLVPLFLAIAAIVLVMFLFISRREA